MKIHLHDFAGHPFQAQLSRALASRGHAVEHGYCADYVSGKGFLGRQPNDPPSLHFLPHTVGRELPKYSLLPRLRYEHLYAQSLAQYLERQRPTVVLLCNVPLTICWSVSRSLQSRRTPWILWHQDILSTAMRQELKRRLPTPLAAISAWELTRRERKYTSNANAVIAIGDAFLALYHRWGISTDRVHLIPNWAPLDEIYPTDRDNFWARDHHLPPERLRLMYTGTLGRKHNPSLLLDLLRGLRAKGTNAHLTIVSEGDGVDHIREAAAALGHVFILPFQQPEYLPQVLGSADILIALLDPEASAFSIPSKVLSYVAAGRPVLGLLPTDNAAAEVVRAAAGVVADPTIQGVALATDWIASISNDEERRRAIGQVARRTAERRFDIDEIASNFEAALTQVLAGNPMPASAP